MPEADMQTLKEQQMQRVKDKELDLLLYLHVIGGTTNPDGTVALDARQASRELSIAQTKLEEAVMWVTKHITR